MKILQKHPDRDFVILNLSDPQMNGFEWKEGHPYAPILRYTIDKLVEDNKPDLITVTGDMAYPEDYDSYETFAQQLDSYNIPWAIVWGNHDHQSGIEPVLKAAELFKSHPLSLFEDGVKLSSDCRKILETAERKIKTLTECEGENND